MPQPAWRVTLRSGRGRHKSVLPLLLDVSAFRTMGEVYIRRLPLPDATSVSAAAFTGWAMNVFQRGKMLRPAAHVPLLCFACLTLQFLTRFLDRFSRSFCASLPACLTATARAWRHVSACVSARRPSVWAHPPCRAFLPLGWPCLPLRVLHRVRLRRQPGRRWTSFSSCWSSKCLSLRLSWNSLFQRPSSNIGKTWARRRASRGHGSCCANCASSVFWHPTHGSCRCPASQCTPSPGHFSFTRAHATPRTFCGCITMTSMVWRTRQTKIGVQCELAWDSMPCPVPKAKQPGRDASKHCRISPSAWAQAHWKALAFGLHPLWAGPQLAVTWSRARSSCSGCKLSSELTRPLQPNCGNVCRGSGMSSTFSAPFPWRIPFPGRLRRASPGGYLAALCTRRSSWAARPPLSLLQPPRHETGAGNWGC